MGIILGLSVGDRVVSQKGDNIIEPQILYSQYRDARQKGLCA